MVKLHDDIDDLRLKEQVYSNEAGDWWLARPQCLPTENRGAVTQSHGRCIVLSKTDPKDAIDCACLDVKHRFLLGTNTQISKISGRSHAVIIHRLADDSIPGSRCPVAKNMTSDEMAREWKSIVFAVACAVAHLHAFGIAHGAVSPGNIVQHQSVWRLGPGLCNSHAELQDDVVGIARILDHIVERLMEHPEELDLAREIRESVSSGKVSVAHIATWVKTGTAQVESPAPGPQCLHLRRIRSGAMRAEVHGNGEIAYLRCALDRFPRVGSIVVESQLDQLGTIIRADANGAADFEIPTGDAEAIVVVSISGGVAFTGAHGVLEPERAWGGLTAAIDGNSLLLQWLWPSDLTCREMRVQIRGDRLPTSADDAETVLRSRYEAEGLWQQLIKREWNRVYVRVSRTDCDEATYATATAERKQQSRRSMWRLFVRRSIAHS